jgi:hypothetical protein
VIELVTPSPPLPLTLDCDAERARDLERAERKYPDYRGERERVGREDSPFLGGRMLFGVELGLYDQQGLFLGMRLPRLKTVVEASATIAFGSWSVESRLDVARPYPNKKQLRAIAARHKRCAFAYALTTTHQDAELRVTWSVHDAMRATTQHFATDARITLPSKAAAVCVKLVVPIWTRTYRGDLYDSALQLQHWSAPSWEHHCGEALEVTPQRP